MKIITSVEAALMKLRSPAINGRSGRPASYKCPGHCLVTPLTAIFSVFFFGGILKTFGGDPVYRDLQIAS